MDISEFCQPEPTQKAVFEGFYPVIIIACNGDFKEVEDNGIKHKVKVITTTLKTTQDTQFPDGSAGRIIIEQQYTIGKTFLKNAINKMAHTAGISEFKDTSEFEGKSLMIGIKNYSWEKEGVTYTKPQIDLFSCAPMNQNSKIEYIGHDFPDADISDDDYKEWFKAKVASYTGPR